MMGIRKWLHTAFPTFGETKEFAPAGLAATVSVLTDQGCCRELNEDYVSCIQPGDPSVRSAKGVLVLLADGMGGCPAGNVASQIAVETLAQSYYDSPLSPGQALRQAFEDANRSLLERAREDQRSEGMGTTCTALALLPSAAMFGHLGDSRLYSIRARTMHQLSEDHTRVMRMVREGRLTLEEARSHEDRNVILRAMGRERSVEGAQWGEPIPVEEGDQFVLCSDGLYDLVLDDEIKEAVLTRGPREACRVLVELARARGGFDNISVAVVLLQRPVSGQHGMPRGTRRTGAGNESTD